MSQPVEHSESELIAFILKGETELFKNLVMSHHQKIYSLCLSFFSNPVDADETAQDIFVKAFQNLKKFRGESSFATWLTRLGINHCKDVLRKKRVRSTDSLDELIEKGREKNINLSSESTHQKMESQEFVDDLLAQLPEKDRRILTLREINALTYEEIAEAMDLTLDAVKARLQRARKELVEKARHFLDLKSV